MRGQRQYALFAGLNKEGSACGHISENGASSFLNRYALHKCNSADASPAVSADSPADILDASWQCFAMTYNHVTCELTGWLNGKSGDRWLENPKNDKLISSAYQAWLQLAQGPVSTDRFASVIYHVPYPKMAKKAHEALRALSQDPAPAASFLAQVKSGLLLPERVGNMHTDLARYIEVAIGIVSEGLTFED